MAAWSRVACTGMRLAAVGAGAATLVLFLKKVNELPVAYHEAGHSVMAVHYASSGASALTLGSPPLHLCVDKANLLRFATVVPRETPNGLFIGETKLSVRWRHMGHHAVWSAWDATVTAAAAGASSAAAPVLDLRPVRVCPSSQNDGGEEQPDRRITLLGARIAYLLGGRVAEDKLAGAATADAGVCLAQLLASPGRARGDLRQIRRLVGGEAMLAEHPELATQAYAYTADVLSQRWSQVHTDVTKPDSIE